MSNKTYQNSNPNPAVSPNPALERIDRDSFEPAYNQLASILRRRIAAGEFAPTERLPSEAELCGQYQVSTITARRAIKILVEEDIAETRKGHGTYLKPLALGNATFDLRGLESIFTDPDTHARILEASVIDASDRIAAKLAIHAGARIIFIRRLLLVSQEPVIYHREYLLLDPTRPMVEAELEVTSLDGLFRGSGHTVLKRGDLCIEATALNKEEGRILKIPEGSPAFQIEHTFYDFNDTAVSWGWFLCQGERLKFRSKVGV